LGIVFGILIRAIALRVSGGSESCCDNDCCAYEEGGRDVEAEIEGIGIGGSGKPIMVCGKSVKPDMVEYSESLSGITERTVEAEMAALSERSGLEKLYLLATGTLLGARPWTGGSSGEAGAKA
jgi:hypothetical protein